MICSVFPETSQRNTGFSIVKNTSYVIVVNKTKLVQPTTVQDYMVYKHNKFSFLLSPPRVVG